MTIGSFNENVCKGRLDYFCLDFEFYWLIGPILRVSCSTRSSIKNEISAFLIILICKMFIMCFPQNMVLNLLQY